MDGGRGTVFGEGGSETSCCGMAAGGLASRGITGVVEEGEGGNTSLEGGKSTFSGLLVPWKARGGRWDKNGRFWSRCAGPLLIVFDHFGNAHSVAVNLSSWEEN